MKTIVDPVAPHQGLHGTRARHARALAILSKEKAVALVVELSSNQGTSITNAIENVMARAISMAIIAGCNHSVQVDIYEAYGNRLAQSRDGLDPQTARVVLVEGDGPRWQPLNAVRDAPVELLRQLGQKLVEAGVR